MTLAEALAFITVYGEEITRGFLRGQAPASQLYRAWQSYERQGLDPNLEKLLIEAVESYKSITR